LAELLHGHAPRGEHDLVLGVQSADHGLALMDVEGRAFAYF
jgi:hypothetical protein